MRWFLLLLALVTFGANAIPDEILASYLDRFELCVKDARIRADSKQDYYDLRDICKAGYLEQVDGVKSVRSNIRDAAPETLDWIIFVNKINKLPSFKITYHRVYLFSHARGNLGDFYISRDKNGRLILWKNGLRIEHSAIPIKLELSNAKYEDNKIMIAGLDSDVYYYATRKNGSYSFHTAYGSELSMNAALFIANKAVIIYDDIPIGVISRNIAKEITE